MNEGPPFTERTYGPNNAFRSEFKPSAARGIRDRLTKENAVNMELPVGMMTPYFVTQADRSIAILEHPAVLVSRNPLTIDILAGFLAFLNEDLPAARSRRRLFGKKEAPSPPRPAIERAHAMLRAIAVEHRWPEPTELIHTRHPVVVLGNTVAQDTLEALVVMKLRGCIQAVALDISTCTDIVPVVLDRLGRKKPDGTVPFADPCGVAGYDSYPGLTVVSGLRATVFATGLAVGQILDQYPELTSAPAEPLTGRTTEEGR